MFMTGRADTLMDSMSEQGCASVRQAWSVTDEERLVLRRPDSGKVENS